MATNLQIDNNLNEAAQNVKDQTGASCPISLSTKRVNIGAAQLIEGQSEFSDSLLMVCLNGPGASNLLTLTRRSEDRNQIARFRLDPDAAVFHIDVGGNSNSGARIHLGDVDSGANPVTTLGNVGIGTVNVGKELEVVGNLVSRASAQAGATAVALAAEGDGLGSLWTNNAYDPADASSGWRRTINMKNGNVGIGGSKNPEAMNPEEQLVVAGNILATGDVRLAGADCAEEFDIEDGRMLDAGTVMVISEDECLRPSTEAYDTKVAGVLSGAGDCHPGIILGKHASENGRLPLALTGKAYCKADAGYAPIAVGDILTTSPTPGHAMKASEPNKAFGAVLGKALRPLEVGKGLVPILVSLQ